MSTPFHRTPQGLSNQAIFAKVDAIVFAEGSGKHFTTEDIESGAGDLSTLDVAFWSTVIRVSMPQRKVEVRSIGNKLTVEAIAQLTATGALSRVIVALDRDFDDRRGRKISHPNVFYTFGYSWENDVFSKEVLIDVIESLAPPAQAFAKAKEDMIRASDELRRCFSTIVRLDHALASFGQEITLRNELERSIRLHEKFAPKIIRSVIAAELMRCRAVGQGRCLGPATCASVDMDLHGHTTSRWWLGQMHHLLRTYTELKMSREVIARLAISAYVRSNNSASLSYYRNITITANW